MSGRNDGPVPPRLRAGPGANFQTRTRWILDTVTAADPDLSEDLVREVLDRVAPSTSRRAAIAADLFERPDRLTSGDPECRLPTQQLVKELVAVGSRTIRRPRCVLVSSAA